MYATLIVVVHAYPDVAVFWRDRLHKLDQPKSNPVSFSSFFY